ncbi:bifunctional serine/threonine-protein kinase/ABC transporter substrate-binding protein [Merismopedia glauca]|uniref:bifunctional serine/threonine-protein kinase/ABC transporter substrate-binding protein n=1 Tax=Merismopedia glauca TaxID=292586 RepID=UPI0015E632F3|nr:bifunctional serine/threonine-protein kinase/ABC transporter substrate-binding protein [Merismopedia glauca]
MEIYCTRPGCAQPLNSFPDLDDSTVLKTVHQRHCTTCGMPLILDGRYLPLQLLRRGGFGAAFIGCDRRTPGLRRCVVKQLQLNPNFSPDQLEIATKLFHREAEVLEKLGEHPRIPRFFAFLELISSPSPPYPQQKFFYLVQDYIEGLDLHKELQARGRFSEAEVVQLLREILEILDFIHSQGAIHRDIKPSNIMRDLQGKLYLVDFGAVKQVVTTATSVPGGLEGSLTGVFTPEYAPWEQRQCRAIYPSSDLYALAVTCLNLLTAKQPPALFDPQTNAWSWRTPDVQVSDRLASILNRMLCDRPTDRFQSARDVLEALNASLLGSTPPPTPAPYFPQTSLPNSPNRKRLIIAGVLGTAIVGIGAIAIFNWLRPIPGNGSADSRSSFGAKILVTSEGGNNSAKFQQLKKAGVAAIAKKNYPEAVTQLEAALQENPNAPETRIYLNNALIGNQKSYTIATSVPITEDTNYRTLEMLRGFAQAQQEVNQTGGVNGAKIKLEIFDDEDKAEVAESIAQELVKRSDVLGVVGHNSSAVSLAAAKIYNQNKLVFITPISITNQLTSADKPYIFRTNVKGDLVAQELANYMLTKSPKRKAAIFYVPGVPYSEDLKAQFSNKVASSGGQIVGNFEFTSPTFNPDTSLQKAIQNGAEAIVLFPTYSQRNKAWNVLRVKQRKYPQLSVFGDIATLYSFDTLQEAGEAATGMILGVSWHVAESDSQFSRDSQQLWKGGINWATATSYNAIKALGTAIESETQPSRERVQNILANSQFTGAGGNFQFFNGEPTEKFTLVKVDKTPPNYPFTSGTGYDFIPLK